MRKSGEYSECQLCAELTSLVVSSRQYIKGIHEKTPSDKILVVARDSAFVDPLTSALEQGGYMSLDTTHGDREADARATGRWIVYDGRVRDRKEKDRILAEVDNAGDLTVVLGTAASLAEGKNLQSCNHLVLLDVM